MLATNGLPSTVVLNEMLGDQIPFRQVPFIQILKQTLRISLPIFIINISNTTVDILAIRT